MRVVLVLSIIAGTAHADPGSSILDPQPLVLQPIPMLDAPPTPQPLPSLRLEAARVAAERFESDWRYPDVGVIAGVEGGQWFLGAAHYRPRTARSAALHAGSMGATILGEILLGTGSPLAGVGALAAGATLDAAAADVDRDAEVRSR